MKVYERDTGPDITGSGTFLGIVWFDGGVWIVERRDGKREWFRAQSACVDWLRGTAERRIAA